ncbi:MAG: Hint domain-containing protein [Tabrizicola sp.]
MPVYTVWMLEKQNITVSGGGSLDGITQGDGSHLVGRTITLNNSNWKETSILDNDTDFEDNDGTQQTLSGAQTINGVTYASGTRVEAEYQIVLTDPDTGKSWTAYAYNVNNSSPAYATIEGLILRPDVDGTYPPVGKALTVTFASEGPRGVGSNLYDLYGTPPCFVPGTLIDTPDGPRRIETLRAGDLVTTLDHGPQPLRWLGRARLTSADLAARPQHVPVRIASGSLGDGLPRRTLTLSPQHRVMVCGWRAELMFGAPEVLVPAVAFLGDRAARLDTGGKDVEYLHLLFDRHEIVIAEGVPVESLLPDWLAATDLPPALRAELGDLFPQGPGPEDRQAARPCLTPREARLVI